MKKTIKKNKPKVSVVVPTYNEETYIEETLLCINNQICIIDYEIFVIDGQSTDNTVNIAKRYATVSISPKKGKVYQLNYISEELNGEIFIFLDADTLIDPYYVQNMYDLFKDDENLFACSARFKYYNEKAISINIGNLRFTITSYFFQNVGMHMWYFFKNLFGFPELSGCNISVRRDVFFNVGKFKNPPKSLGIDKVLSDSILYYIKKIGKGKIRTLNFISVLTSGRNLSVNRSLKRINQYRNKKDVYYTLARNLKK